MEEKDLPVCFRCDKRVIGYTMISEEVFTEDGPQTIRSSVVMSCGCNADFVKYNIDCEEGYVELEDLMNEQTLVEWELKFPAEEGDDPWM